MKKEESKKKEEKKKVDNKNVKGKNITAEEEVKPPPPKLSIINNPRST